MRFLLIYCYLLFTFIAVFAQNNPALVQVLNEDAIQGKAGCLLFSKKGFFYAGTTEGLFLFNGNSLRPLTKKSDSVQKVTALYEDAKGVLWIGCADGSVFYFFNNLIHAWKPQEGLPQKGISSFAEDEKHQLWIATKGEGLYVYSNSKLYNINTADGLSDDYVYDLVFINSQIVAATDQGIGICNLNKGQKQIKVINTSKGLADNIVQTVAKDPSQKNIVWLGFQNGNAGYFDFTTNSYQTIYKADINAASVLKILPLDAEVWVAGDNQLNKFNRTEASTVSGTLLPSFVDLSKDAEGNIWILTGKGLFRSAGEQLQSLFSIPEDEVNFMNDMVVDEKGCYWLTTKGGITCYKSVNNMFQRTLITLPLHPKSEVTCMYMSNDQTIWIGTMGDGVFTFNTVTKKHTHIKKAPEIDKASILSITGTSQNIWINSLEGVWRYSINSSEFEKISTVSSTGSAYIYYVFEDSKGRVWFATDGKGISVLENGKYKSFREKDGLMAKVVYSVAEDKYGNLWFTTLNSGVYKYDGNKFIHFGNEQGLSDLSISSISTDTDGSVFCVGAKACFLINAKTGVISTAVLPEQTGIINTNLNSSYSAFNKTWFQAGSHIYLYRQPSYKLIAVPQTQIINVQLFLTTIDTAVKEFAYNENNLSFTFTGFYYSDPSKVSYQYKLEGYNMDWQTTKDGFVNFPKLLPANYIFRVRSSANANFENNIEAVYKFTINKPFWRTWWFLLISISAITAIIIYIIKAREAEVQKMQQLQTEKLKSQYETLKNQVNPHFLFNSFNTLLNVIDEEPEKASVYVEHLSDFYRSIVNLREKDLIPLGDEIRIIEHYFFIQKKRFGAALQFVNEVSEFDKVTYFIPPLTLQLLAENAVKHNSVSKENPLTLRLTIEKNILFVSNNINKKINNEKGEGLGLQNIKNRFYLIARKEVTVQKTDKEFIVALPLINVV